MSKKETAIERFFPTREARRRASEAIEKEATEFLSRYPAGLVSRVQRLKAAGIPLKEISERLGHDPRVPAIAMHLAVKNQGKAIGEA